MRKLILSLFFLQLLTVVRGQDLHFTQYHTSPTHLNPAMTGILYDGSVVTLNYRDQWRSLLGADKAFITTAGTYERRFNINNSNFFGVGVGILQDKAGALTQSEVKLAVSYARLMTKRNKGYYYIIGGAQAGAFQSIVNINDRRWLGQYDGNGGFDATKQGDLIDYPKKTLMDVSMGVALYALYENRNYWVLGGAIHHLNKADISLNKYTLLPVLQMRYTGHLAGSIYLGDSHLKILPSTLFMKQGESVELMPNIALKYVMDLTDYRSFQLGTGLRLVNRLETNKLMTDAFVSFMRVDWVNFGMGFSYDVNVSSLNITKSSNNSVELSLCYRFNPTYYRKKVITPRYFD
jgi:type IX secretion system PorP/SprF family membrane protein